MRPQIRKVGKNRRDELEEFLSLSMSSSPSLDGTGSVPLLLVDARVIQTMMEHIESTNKLLKKLTTSPKNLWLSHKETCEFLGVSDTTLREYRDIGLIAYHKRDRQLWFHLNDIEEFLNNHREEAFQYRK